MTSSNKRVSQRGWPKGQPQGRKGELPWPRPRPPRRTSTPASLSTWLTTPRSLPSARRRLSRLRRTLLVLARLAWIRRSWTSVRTSTTPLLTTMSLSPTRTWLRSLAALLRRWALPSVTSSRRSVSSVTRVRRRAILPPSRLLSFAPAAARVNNRHLLCFY